MFIWCLDANIECVAYKMIHSTYNIVIQYITGLVVAIQSYVLNRVFNQGPTVLIAYTIVVVFSKIRFFFSFVDHGVESAARLVLLEH